MKTLVLNGSPAGKDSITLQTVEFLKIFFPEQEFNVLHVGKKIKSIEKDFREAKEALEAADLILFCYPVYTFLVPAQLHRFIELIRENGVDISGKYATQISTSKHFYDITAHRFIEDACAELGLRYVRGLSADMEDILKEKGQEEAKSFFRFLLWNMEKGYCEKPSVRKSCFEEFEPVLAAGPDGAESNKAGPTEAEAGTAGKDDKSHKAFGACAAEKIEQDHSSGYTESDDKSKKHIDGGALHAALVTDYDPASPPKALLAMIRRFEGRFPGSLEKINLREFPFKGGCLGCFNCASDGKCIYKDGFDDYLRQHINSADAVVYAYTIKDHSMGYRFKLYDDRQFCNGHRTVTMGKPVGYLVDGKLSEEENLRVLMEARAQVGGNYLAGVATDENDPDREIDQMADTLVYAAKNHYNQPENFYGAGGRKIFRDLIYEMQGLMKEDHRFYKKHGFYEDFPQKKKGRIIGMYLVSAMMKNEKIRKKFSMTDGMMMSYKKALEKARRDRKPY